MYNKKKKKEPQDTTKQYQISLYLILFIVYSQLFINRHGHGHRQSIIFINSTIYTVHILGSTNTNHQVI